MGIIRNGKKAPNPRTHILTNLPSFIATKKQDNNNIIIIMDATDKWGGPTSPLATFMKTMHYTVFTTNRGRSLAKN